MRKTLSFFAVLLMAFSVFADTFAYIELSDLGDGTSLSSFKAEASLILPMKEIASYDIGFSRVNNISNPDDIISSFDLTPVFSEDYSAVGSASQPLYIYWDIVSNLTLTFSLSMSGPMVNETADDEHKYVNWLVSIRSAVTGDLMTMDSSDEGTYTVADFASYVPPENSLGDSDYRVFSVSVSDTPIESIATGTYVGTLTLNVSVE